MGDGGQDLEECEVTNCAIVSWAARAGYGHGCDGMDTPVAPSRDQGSQATIFVPCGAMSTRRVESPCQTSNSGRAARASLRRCHVGAHTHPRAPSMQPRSRSGRSARAPLRRAHGGSAMRKPRPKSHAERGTAYVRMGLGRVELPTSRLSGDLIRLPSPTFCRQPSISKLPFHRHLSTRRPRHLPTSNAC